MQQPFDQRKGGRRTSSQLCLSSFLPAHLLVLSLLSCCAYYILPLPKLIPTTSHQSATAQQSSQMTLLLLSSTHLPPCSHLPSLLGTLFTPSGLSIFPTASCPYTFALVYHFIYTGSPKSYTKELISALRQEMRIPL